MADRNNPADYVFVDEHNRHKRLKGTWKRIHRRYNL
jgi:hypothetical protein